MYNVYCKAAKAVTTINELSGKVKYKIKSDIYKTRYKSYNLQFSNT